MTTVAFRGRVVPASIEGLLAEWGVRVDGEITIWPGTGHGVRSSPLAWLGRALVSRYTTWDLRGARGEPDAVARFEVRDGRPECTEITIRAKPEGRGIRTADLQSLKLDSLAVEVFTEQAIAAEGALIEKDIYAARTKRRTPPSIGELQQVAQIYRDYVSSAPVQAVAQLLGYPTRTAHRRVQQAERAGLLPPTTPGKKRKSNPPE